MSKRSIKKRHGKTPSFKELCQQGMLRKSGLTGFDQLIKEQMEKNPDFAKAFEQAVAETVQANEQVEVPSEEHVHGEGCSHTSTLDK